MRLLNLAFIAISALVLFADYLREKKRLATIEALPPVRARALFERGHRQRERFMLVVTVVLAAAAVVSLTVMTTIGHGRP